MVSFWGYMPRCNQPPGGKLAPLTVTFWLNFKGMFNTHVLPFLSWSTSCREAASLRSQALSLKISTLRALKKRQWDKKQSRHVHFKSGWLVIVQSSGPFLFHSTYLSWDLDIKTKLTVSGNLLWVKSTLRMNFGHQPQTSWVYLQRRAAAVKRKRFWIVDTATRSLCRCATDSGSPVNEQEQEKWMWLPPLSTFANFQRCIAQRPGTSPNHIQT